jgi:hypothetical protein
MSISRMPLASRLWASSYSPSSAKVGAIGNEAGFHEKRGRTPKQPKVKASPSRPAAGKGPGDGWAQSDPEN